uniref:Ubiquitin-like domain-containing protein n=1 Tax=Chrysotila carterae TaxID=13221 RepID=A0A7S4C1Z5_CHRCT
MRIRLALGGNTHVIEASEDETLGSLKTRLAQQCGVEPQHQRWLLKGSKHLDTMTFKELALKDDAKVMVLRTNKDAATASATTATTASMTASSSVSSDQTTGSESKTDLAQRESNEPVQVGTGSMMLIIKHGKKTYHLHCEADATVLQLKHTLKPAVAGLADHQRLLVSGCELANTDTVRERGLLDGSRVMLLFKEGHHARVEGVHLLEQVATQIAGLQERLSKLEKRHSHRVNEAPLLLTALGALADEVEAAVHDVNNAQVPEGEHSQKRQDAQKELEQMRARIRQLRESISTGP